MDAYELEVARSKYNEKQKELSNKTQIERQIINLLQDPNVLKYLDLKRQLSTSSQITSDYNTLKNIFYNDARLAETKKSNHIMIYNGTFTDASPEPLRNIASESSSYLRFIDVETQEVKEVFLDNLEEFEANNITLYSVLDDYTEDSLSQEFANIQSTFFKILMSNTQKKAIEILMNTYITSYKELLAYTASGRDDDISFLAKNYIYKN